jgi:hypothetical protein
MKTNLAFWSPSLLHGAIICLPTALALAGVLCLLAASLYLGLEVSLAVRSFDEELDLEMVHRKD